MNALRTLSIGLMLTAAAACDRTSSTHATPDNSGTGGEGMGTHADITGPAEREGNNPGGPPVFGVATGTGFSTGDSDQAGGMGSGLEGFHGLGAAGTSGSITDKSEPVAVQELGMSKSAAK